MKLASKRRDGARVARRHDAPATPCDRLLASPHIDRATKERLCSERASLNPYELSRRIEAHLRLLWQTQRTPAAK